MIGTTLSHFRITAKHTAAPTATGPASADDEETQTELLTREGTVVGTTPYMSPEQLRGQKVDARSDVFALGILLYEMATGSRPFQGATVMDLASNILTAQPQPLGEVRAELPRQLGRILLGMGLVHDLTGNHQEAVDSFEACLELDPDSTQCLLFGGLALHHSGRHDAALGSFRKVSQQNPDHPLASPALLNEAVELGHLGRADEQAVALETAERRFKAHPKMWFNLAGLAGVAAQRGDLEAALAWLRQAIEAGMKSLNVIRNDPSLEPLHGDPRFEEILESLRPGQEDLGAVRAAPAPASIPAS